MRTTRKRSAREIGIAYGFRSGFEKTASDELEELGVDFTYEKTKIEYTKPAKKARYTPDFIITTRLDGVTKKKRPLVIETKGRFLASDRQKHLLIQNQHPELDIRFVFQNAKSKIAKGSKTTYAMWAEKNGFQWAHKSIPHKWIDEP